MKLITSLLVAACCILAPASYAADVTVHLHLVSPQELEVSYQLPEKCDSVAFLNHETLPMFGGEIRGAWKPVDDCGTADGKQITRTNASCSQIRFRVPASNRIYDRVSPGSFPMGEGLFAHTTNYAVNEQCGSVGYRFSADGSIVLKGKIFEQSASYDEVEGQYLAVLLLQKTIKSNGNAITYFNPALGAETSQLIQSIADQSISFYRQQLPKLHFRKPVLAATVLQDGRDPYYWGDAGDILRLALYNWPQQPTTETDFKLRNFIWHEFAHRFQPVHKIENDGLQPYQSEGGADFLRWYGGIKKKWLSKEQASSEIDAAVSTCISLVEDYSWKNLPDRARMQGQFPYSCGLALHVFGLAERQTKVSALQQFSDYYQAIDDGKTNNFVQAIECGKLKNCSPKWLAQLLGDTSIAKAWQELFAETKLARITAPKQNDYSEIQSKAFASLMQGDCHGNYGYSTNPKFFEVDRMQLTCTHLRDGMKITQIEGKDLFGKELIVDQLNQICTSRGSVNLGLDNGETLALPCTANFKMPTFYAVDMDKLSKKLGL